MINNYYGSELELCFGNITYISSKQVSEINNLYQTIVKFFTNHKYSSEDLIRYGNEYPQFSLDLEPISNNCFDIINICSQQDLDEQSELKKGMPEYQNLLEILSVLTIEKYLSDIDEIYVKLIQDINENHFKDKGIKLETPGINTKYL
ncbi:MAG: CRISPR-associated protein Csn2-St [Bacilli bacterium]